MPEESSSSSWRSALQLPQGQPHSPGCQHEPAPAADQAAHQPDHRAALEEPQVPRVAGVRRRILHPPRRASAFCICGARLASLATEDRYRCQMVQGSANSSSIPHSPRGSLLKPPPLCNSIFNWPCPVLSQRTSCPATTPSGSLLNHSSRFSRTLSSTRNSMGWTTALPTVRDVISDFPQHDGHIRLVPEETNHKPLRTRATSDWARQTAT